MSDEVYFTGHHIAKRIYNAKSSRFTVPGHILENKGVCGITQKEQKSPVKGHGWEFLPCISQI